MANIARSTLQKHKEEQEALSRRYAATLAKKSIVREPVNIPKIWDNLPYYPTLVVGNSLKTFNQSIKSKDVGKIKELLAFHMYGRFKVPRHLRLIWHYKAPEAGRYGQQRNGLSKKDVELRQFWYAIVASGGSLHKLATSNFFTKKETHRFLTAPKDVSFEEAIIYAYGKGYTDDTSVVMRCYKSKLVKQDVINNTFWREVLRFFCVNPVHIDKMNDLLDYIIEERRQNPEWSIKGRTLNSLTTEMIQWHRTLARAKRMGNASWEGIPVDDQIVETTFNGKKIIWTLTQIRNSKDLAQEGSKMHHCVPMPMYV